MDNAGSIFLALAIVWVLQLALSLLQTRRFHRKVSDLRRGNYASAVGMSGSTWKRKVYGVLVVDETLTVQSGHELSGITVFADLKPVPGVVDVPLSRIEEDQPLDGVKPKIWAALQQAARFIRNHESRRDDVAEQQEILEEKEAGIPG